MFPFGPYELQEVIGTGGMGTVHRAWQRSLKRFVAIKLVSVKEPQTVEQYRFRREMRVLSQLSHPNIVQVYDGGVVENQPYLAMELLAGETLLERIGRDGRMSWREGLTITLALADALAYLHHHEILHRDLKPSNIFLTSNGTPKLIDFGLAIDPTSTRITGAGQVVGTMAYFAPELLAGQDPTPQSDIWALGASVYWMLAGRLHLDIKEGMPNIKDLVKGRTVPLARVVPELPAAVALLVDEMLAPDRSVRAGSAATVAQRCRALLEVPSLSSNPTRRSGGQRRLLPGLLLLAAIVLGLLYPFWRFPVPAQREAKAIVVTMARPGPGYFDLWRVCAEERHHLLKGGAEAEAAIVALQRRTGVQLAKEPDLWLYWIRLGEWLERGNGPAPRRELNLLHLSIVDDLLPNLARTVLSTLEIKPLDWAIQQGSFPHGLGAFVRPPPIWLHSSLRLLELAVNQTALIPDNARGWLLLGLVLDLDARPSMAAIAYRKALPLVKVKEFQGFPVALWVAYARAQRFEPGGRQNRDDLAAGVQKLGGEIAEAMLPDEAYLRTKKRVEDTGSGSLDELYRKQVEKFRQARLKGDRAELERLSAWARFNVWHGKLGPWILTECAQLPVEP